MHLLEIRALCLVSELDKKIYNFLFETGIFTFMEFMFNLNRILL